MSDPNTNFTATADCSFGSPYIVCKETAGGSEANFPGSSTSSYDVAVLTNSPVTVTAGAEQLFSGDVLAATGAESSKIAVSTSALRESAATGTPIMTLIACSGSASGSAIASRTSVAPATVSTAAAAVNGVAYAGGLVGAAAGVFGALLL